MANEPSSGQCDRARFLCFFFFTSVFLFSFVLYFNALFKFFSNEIMDLFVLEDKNRKYAYFPFVFSNV